MGRMGKESKIDPGYLANVVASRLPFFGIRVGAWGSFPWAVISVAAVSNKEKERARNSGRETNHQIVDKEIPLVILGPLSQQNN